MLCVYYGGVCTPDVIRYFLSYSTFHFEIRIQCGLVIKCPESVFPSGAWVTDACSDALLLWVLGVWGNGQYLEGEGLSVL